MASREDPSNSSFMDHFSCKICLEILNQPVQCRRNEHYFCTACITNHLKQLSQTCPLCIEELTVETLRPAPRLVTEVVSQFKIPRCNYVDRGCKEVVKLEDLPLHHEVCGFAAVVCCNEGCGETVNRQDQSSHENESCKFRKVKCEVCEEEMVYRDYETHRCLMRKEIDEVKSSLTCSLTQVRNEMSEMRDCLKEIQEQVKTNNQCIQDLQDPLRNVVPSSLICVAGPDKSVEVFNWSTKTWTLYKDVLFYPHHYSFCFSYKNNIMVCGGDNSNRVEYLNIKKDPITSHTFPVSLPGGKGTLCGNRILTFENNEVHEIVLEPPRSSRAIASLEKSRRYYGVECINENVIILGGEIKTKENIWHANKELDTVELYNTSSNEMKELAPLPYGVSKMATVPYKDNIIVLGGENGHAGPLNNVIMYNITNEESQKLPSMLQKRSGCAAVIMEDVIVVMGGIEKYNYTYRPPQKLTSVNTVECYVLGQDSWSKLPPMHHMRDGATACAQE